jgi:hypothetical protein
MKGYLHHLELTSDCVVVGHLFSCVFMNLLMNWVEFRAPIMVLILGIRKVVKSCCCCSKNHVLLYWINAFEILAYVSGIHEVVVLISCLDWIVVLWLVLWESDDILGSGCLNVNWVSVVVMKWRELGW